MQKRNRRRRQSGVTLIEMLVVVTIIALFAALVAPRMISRYLNSGRVTAAHAQINSFLTFLGDYNRTTGTYPTTEQGLKALREKPEGVNGWEGPYMPQDVPTDPWGHPYIYKFPGDHGLDPDIICLGADGAPGGEGYDADIVSWKSK